MHDRRHQLRRRLNQRLLLALVDAQTMETFLSLIPAGVLVTMSLDAAGKPQLSWTVPPHHAERPSPSASSTIAVASTPPMLEASHPDSTEEPRGETNSSLHEDATAAELQPVQSLQDEAPLLKIHKKKRKSYEQPPRAVKQRMAVMGYRPTGCVAKALSRLHAEHRKATEHRPIHSDRLVVDDSNPNDELVGTTNGEMTAQSFYTVFQTFSTHL